MTSSWTSVGGIRDPASRTNFEGMAERQTEGAKDGTAELSESQEDVSRVPEGGGLEDCLPWATKLTRKN